MITLGEKLKIIAETSVSNLRKIIDYENINACGNLKKSITYQISPTFISITFPAYAVAVDEGTKSLNGAPQPPGLVVSIKNWMDCKGIDNELLYPIVNKLRKEGITPHPFLYEFEATLLDFSDEFLDLIDVQIEDSVYGKFQKIFNY
jgi:hypothetical protein